MCFRANRYSITIKHLFLLIVSALWRFKRYAVEARPPYRVAGMSL